MKQLLWVATVCLASSLGFASDVPAQALGYDNVHIRVSDPAKAVEWYVKNLGGTTPTAGQVYFGKALIAVVKTNDPKPSVGSVIDHIGFSFADIDTKVKALEAAGAKVISAPRDSLLRYAYIEDPWGIKIEIVQDPDTMGFHHVHLRVKDPVATLAWYEQMFGGRRDKLKGQLDGLRFGDVWLFAASSGNDTTVPSADRAIMSVGVRVASIDKATAALKSKGVKFPVEPRQLGQLWYAFGEDPNGARVELLQRPPE